MHVNSKECAAAGIDEKEVKKIAQGLSRYARRAQKLGLLIFGGSGSGDLRFRLEPDKGALICACLDGAFDGGDGANGLCDDGLERGEQD